ncbi:MAG TPA: DUF3299 domain-containing protein [Verrucomicrobiae bacterium]|nr:DUF3299 domain-containing protein [Verrucomicrobiae bacterium]
MRTLVIITLFAVYFTRPVNGQGQVHGDSITGFGSSNTNAAVSAPAGETKTNVSVATHANVADGTLIGFDKLAGFPFTVSDDLLSTTNQIASADEKVNAMIPADIRALDHRKLSIEGFMVPIQYDNGKTADFMLVRAPFSCCFGSPPQTHELVMVHLKPPGVELITDGPVRARGVLHVGAQREQGYLSSIYSMDAESLEKSPDQ